MSSCPEIGSEGEAGIVNERSYVSPSIVSARRVASESATPGAGSRFSDGFTSLRQPVSKKAIRRSKSSSGMGRL
jgi:hypothetical protein